MAELRKPSGGPIFGGALMTPGAKKFADDALATYRGAGTEMERTSKIIHMGMDLIRSTTEAAGVATGRLVAEQIKMPPIFADLAHEMSKSEFENYTRQAMKVRGVLDPEVLKRYGLGRSLGNLLLPYLLQTNTKLAEFIANNKGEITLSISKPLLELNDLLAADAPGIGKNLKLISDAVDQVRGLAPVDMNKLVEFGNFDKRMDAFFATWTRRWEEFKSTFGVNFGKLGKNLEVTPEIAAAREKEEGAKRAVTSDTFGDRFGTWKEPKVPDATEAAHFTGDMSNAPGGRFNPNAGADGNFGLSSGAGFSSNIEDRRNLEADTSATAANTEQLKRLNDTLERAGPLGLRQGFTSAAAGGGSDAGGDPAAGGYTGTGGAGAGGGLGSLPGMGPGGKGGYAIPGGTAPPNGTLSPSGGPANFQPDWGPHPGGGPNLPAIPSAPGSSPGSGLSGGAKASGKNIGPPDPPAVGPAGGAAGPQPSAGAIGDNKTVPSDILAKAKQVALQSGPGGVAAYMRAQGYPKAGSWCGEFAASVVKGVGGTPPKDPEVASNWRNYGTGVEGAPQGRTDWRRRSWDGVFTRQGKNRPRCRRYAHALVRGALGRLPREARC